MIKRSIEIEGNTIEDAIKKAMKILNAPRNAILIKVVCEEQKGLFGMEGAKRAKVVATIK